MRHFSQSEMKPDVLLETIEEFNPSVADVAAIADRMGTAAIIVPWRTMWFVHAANAEINQLPEDDPRRLPEHIETLERGCTLAGRRASMFLHNDERPDSGQAKDLAQLIGYEKFDEIYGASPPTALIDYILSEANAERVKAQDPNKTPALTEIAFAVSMGQTEMKSDWEKHFAKAGVSPYMTDPFSSDESAQ